MNNKEVFITGYLGRIAQKFNITEDLAFEVFSISAVLDKSFQEVYDNVIIKGPRDGGIDGVHFSEQGDYYVMYVFQSKNSKSIKPNQVDKFRNDFKDVFVDGNKANRPNIEDLQPKIDEYNQLSKAGFIIEPKLYFLFNGEKIDPTRGGNQQAFQAYHDVDNGFEILDSDDLYDKISNLVKAQSRRKTIKHSFQPENSNISLNDNQALYSYSIQNIRSANFRIKAIELCTLIDLEMDENATYDYLFSDNIRGFLGMRARANQKMFNTLDDPNESIYFPFLNNGLTIICEKLILPNSPQNGDYVIPTTNPVIVNGLQTTRVLYSIYKSSPTKLANVFVNIRLYESDDTTLVNKITDATNTQTPINYRDKVSNKDFNSWAKEIFAINNVGYITKRGELFSNKFSNDFTESIGSDTILKFWFATFYEKPDIAKNSVATVLETIYDATDTENPLNKLFNGDKDSPVYRQLYLSFLIYKKVQAEKEIRKEEVEFIVHADELLSYGVYKKLESNLSNIQDPDQMIEAYNYSLGIISEIVTNDLAIHTEAGRIFSYPSYFKRPKCKVDYNSEADIIETESLIEDLLAKQGI